MDIITRTTRAAVLIAALTSMWLAPTPAAAAAGTASLYVTINPGTTSIQKGVPTPFTITVTNRGPNPAPNTTARITLLQDPGTFTIKFAPNLTVSANGWTGVFTIGTMAVGQTATTTATVTGLVITGSNANAVKATFGVAMTTDANNPLQYDNRAGTFARHIEITTVRTAPSPSPSPSTTRTPTPVPATTSATRTQMPSSSARASVTPSRTTTSAPRTTTTVKATPAKTRATATATPVLTTQPAETLASESATTAAAAAQRQHGGSNIGLWIATAAVLCATGGAALAFFVRRQSRS